MSFNIYLLIYFTKMLKFLYNVIAKDASVLQPCFMYSAYIGFIIFVLIYLLNQYLFQNTQYAIVGIYYLVLGELE